MNHLLARVAVAALVLAFTTSSKAQVLLSDSYTPTDTNSHTNTYPLTVTPGTYLIRLKTGNNGPWLARNCDVLTVIEEKRQCQYDNLVENSDNQLSRVNSASIRRNNANVVGAAINKANPIKEMPVTLTATQNINFLVQGFTTSSAQFSIEAMPAENIPPHAFFSLNKTTLYAPGAVAFNGTAAHDPNGGTLTYDWDFGDGSAHDSTVSPTHTYSVAGTYTAKLTVTDPQGATDELSVIILAKPSAPSNPPANIKPVPVISYSFPDPNNKRIITFSSAGSHDDDGMIVKYAWQMGDGYTFTGPSLTHQFALDGTYYIVLTATDDAGGATNETLALPVKVDGQLISQPEIFNSGPLYGSNASQQTTTFTVNVPTPVADRYMLRLVNADGQPHTVISPCVGTTAERLACSQNNQIELQYINSNRAEWVQTILNNRWIVPGGQFNKNSSVFETPLQLQPGSNTLKINWKGFPSTFATVSIYPMTNHIAPVAQFSVGQTSTTAPSAMTFTAFGSYAGSPITNYSWDFGDGTIDEGLYVTHIYPTPGNFMVTLTITTLDGETASQTQPVSLSPPLSPFAWFNTNIQSGLGDLVLTVDASGTLFPQSNHGTFLFDFGDGATASTMQATHTYAAPGFYQVKLTATDDTGASAERIFPVDIRDSMPPFLTITAPSSQSVDAGSMTNVAGTSNEKISSATARVDGGDETELAISEDGLSFSGPVVTAMAGPHNLNVTIMDRAGNMASQARSFVRGQTVSADFIFSPKYVKTNQNILFTATADSANGEVNQYSWSFGDGPGSAAGPAQNHMFMSAGTYNVTLTATDSAGIVTETTKQVVVSGAELPVPSFSISTDTDLGTLNVSVDGSASTSPNGAITNFHFSFGDGQELSAASGQHVFEAPGTYAVTLTVTDAAGLKNQITQDVIVKDSAAPMMTLTSPLSSATLVGPAIPVAGTVSEPISAATAYLDGATALTIAPDGLSFTGNVRAEFVGTKIVKVTTTDRAGNLTSANVSVTIMLPPKPVFSVLSTAPVAGEPQTFSAVGSFAPSGTIVEYLWDFGDSESGFSFFSMGFGASSTATGPVVTHTYANGGTYIVTLTTTDNLGFVSTIERTVSVYTTQPLVADFTATVGTAPETSRVFFDASASTDASNSIASYYYNFGDGSTATTSIAEHTYFHPGTYAVSLTVINTAGEHSTKSINVVIQAPAPFDPNMVLDFISPRDNQTVSGEVLVAGFVRGATGAAQIDVMGIPVTPTFANGQYYFEARRSLPANALVSVQVTDSAGHVATKTRVINLPPHWFDIDVNIEPAHAFACGVTKGNDGPVATGALYCWGNNEYGQLGRGTTSTYEANVEQSGSILGWNEVRTGDDTACAIRNIGELWCWGRNSFGQAGVGDTDQRNTPVQVGTETNWLSVSVNSEIACGISGGALYCWGNLNKLVGLPASGFTLTPQQIGSDTTWSRVDVGHDAICGINQGALYCWGQNTHGVLGDGESLQSAPTPQRVGTLDNWGAVSVSRYAACGIAGYALMCWGDTTAAPIGTGEISGQIPPTQIGSSHEWTQISRGISSTCGIEQNKLLCWGTNSYGEIGNSTVAPVFTPAVIDEDQAWTDVRVGFTSTCGVKGGSAYCWGGNSYGQLGSGDTASAYTPHLIDLPAPEPEPLQITSTTPSNPYAMNGVEISGTGDQDMALAYATVDGAALIDLPVTGGFGPPLRSFHGGAQLTPGPHAIKLTAVSMKGAIATTNANLQVVGVTPFAIISANPANGISAGAPVTFFGLTSYSPNGMIRDYLWDFGDGSTAATGIATHSFNQPGNYNVQLTIVDETEATATQTFQVMVMAPIVPPSISLSYQGPASVTIAENSISVGVVVTSPYNTTTVVSLNGSPLFSTGEATFAAPVTLTQIGPNMITVTSADQWGVIAEPKSISITVSPAPKIITFIAPLPNSNVAIGSTLIKFRSTKPMSSAKINGVAATLSADKLVASRTVALTTAGPFAVTAQLKDEALQSYTATMNVNVYYPQLAPWNYEECPIE